MLPQDPQLDPIRHCYGKHFDERHVGCVGDSRDPNRGACNLHQSCALEVAHRAVHRHLVPAQSLNRSAAPAYASGASPPRSANYSPPPAAMTPAPPPARAPFAPPPAQQAPYAGHVPTTVGGVHMIPHSTMTPSMLSKREARKPGNLFRSLVGEMFRAAAKGSAGQLANFMDETPIFGDEDK